MRSFWLLNLYFKELFEYNLLFQNNICVLKRTIVKNGSMFHKIHKKM